MAEGSVAYGLRAVTAFMAVSCGPLRRTEPSVERTRPPVGGLRRRQRKGSARNGLLRCGIAAGFVRRRPARDRHRTETPAGHMTSAIRQTYRAAEIRPHRRSCCDARWPAIATVARLCCLSGRGNETLSQIATLEYCDDRPSASRDRRPRSGPPRILRTR